LFFYSLCSGGASAVKEPGHLEVRKSSSQVTGCTFFLKKFTTVFLVVALKTQRPPTPFEHQNKTNKAVRYVHPGDLAGGFSDQVTNAIEHKTTQKCTTQ